MTAPTSPTGASRVLGMPPTRSRLGEAYSAVGVLVNIGVPVLLQLHGQVEGAPWPLQAALWILFLLLRLDPVQTLLGGGSLEHRNGRRTALGCASATAAVTAAGVPEMTAAACGLVMAVHLQWHHHRALLVGAPATAALVGVTAWAQATDLLPHPSGELAPWLSLAAFGYAISTVGNLAFLAAQQRIVRAELRRVAERDPLTGLLNRRALDQVLEVAASTAHPGQGVAVLFCDIDHFKAINDQHGHGAGDDVLVQVATRLRAATRHGTVIGRPGGDEFVVVVTDLAEIAHAEIVAQRLRAAFTAPFELDGVQVGGGVSIGVYATEQATTARGLLAGADAAMYAAKTARTCSSGPSRQDEKALPAAVPPCVPAAHTRSWG